MPALAGLVTRALMAEHGVSAREIAQVSVKNHANATRNPYAHFPHAVSMEEVMESRMVADPLRLLQGSGKQVRSIRLETASTLETPGVRALLKAAVAQSDVPMPSGGRGTIIIKSVSAKQRPRRVGARAR